MSYDEKYPPKRHSTNEELRQAERAGLAARLPLIQPASFDKVDWLLLTPPAEIAAAHVAAVAVAP